jgi:hypothetical protein
MNEFDLSDDHVIRSVVKFCAFGRVEATEYSARVWPKFIALMKKFVVLLKMWSRKDYVPRHIGKAVLTARSSGHAIFSEASQRMMVLPMLHATDVRSDARLIARVVAEPGC